MTNASTCANGDMSQVPVHRSCDVKECSRADLAERWQSIYGHPPPRGVRRGLLERAAAWHEQAKHQGGLSAAVARELRAEVLDPERDKPKKRMVIAQPGTRLVREWGGQTHVVDITERGCEWNSRTYRSLSAVARAITGARWSGPRFFGLGSGNGDS